MSTKFKTNGRKAISATFLSLFLLILILPFPKVKAQESDDTTTEEETSAITEDQQEDIDALRKEIQKKVEEKLNDIETKEEKRAWIGTIEEKGNIDFKLKTGDEIRTVSLSEDLTIVDSKRKEMEFADLETEERVIVMGYLQTDGTLEAKRIVITTPRAEERKTRIIFGNVNNKSNEEEILSIVGSDEKEYELILTSKTVLFQRSENKVSKIKYEDIEGNSKIVAVLQPTEENDSTYNPKIVLVLNQSTEVSPTPQDEE